MPTAIKVANLQKSFGSGKSVQRALDDVSFAVKPGEMVAVVGDSGSGKSTLLGHIAGRVSADRNGARCHVSIAGLCVQEKGRIVEGVRSVCAEARLVLLEQEPVRRGPLLTTVVRGGRRRAPRWRRILFPWITREERRRALACLDRVGLAEHARRQASLLSAGQHRCAALARALAQRPRILLADEPHAGLDPDSAERVLEHLARLNRESNVTVMVAMTDIEIALRHCRRVIALCDGRVVYDGPTACLPDALSGSGRAAVTPRFRKRAWGPDSRSADAPEMHAAAVAAG